MAAVSHSGSIPGCAGAQQCVTVAHFMSPVTPTEQPPSQPAPEKSSWTTQAELYHIKQLQQEPFLGGAKGQGSQTPGGWWGEATAAPNVDV